jgi:hypothetical protein
MALPEGTQHRKRTSTRRRGCGHGVMEARYEYGYAQRARPANFMKRQTLASLQLRC